MPCLADNFLKELISERPSLVGLESQLKAFLVDPSVIDKKVGDSFDYYFTEGYIEFPDPKVSKYPVSLSRGLRSISKSQKYVYISSADTRDGSYKYRTEFQSRLFRNSLIVHKSTPLPEAIKFIFSSEKLIFNRPDSCDLSFYFLDIARALGIQIVLDYDDLLLPEFTELTGYTRSREGQNLDANRQIAIERTAFFAYAQKFQLSTLELADCFAHLGKEIKICPNKLPLSGFAPISSVIRKCSDIPDRNVNFLYMSGTYTHAMDFSILLPVLIKIAQEYRDRFSLTVFGRAKANSGFQCLKMYSKYIHFIDRVSFDQMLKYISYYDVCLVPLEDTKFNRCKSNIKFIECASQGVPTIASDLPEFSNYISHSVNGWLSRHQADWYHNIKSIIENPSQIKKSGLLARQTAVEFFSIP